MNFELGYYRTRDGSIVKITHKGTAYLAGRAVVSPTIHLNRTLYWNENGDANYYVESLDLMEYLKIKENNRHDGVPLKTYIEKNLGVDSKTR